MEHVTEGMYMAAAAGLFLLAVSLMCMVGRCVDDLVAAEQEVRWPGMILWEETWDE